MVTKFPFRVPLAPSQGELDPGFEKDTLPPHIAQAATMEVNIKQRMASPQARMLCEGIARTSTSGNAVFATAMQRVCLPADALARRTGRVCADQARCRLFRPAAQLGNQRSRGRLLHVALVSNSSSRHKPTLHARSRCKTTGPAARRKLR